MLHIIYSISGAYNLSENDAPRQIEKELGESDSNGYHHKVVNKIRDEFQKINQHKKGFDFRRKILDIKNVRVDADYLPKQIDEPMSNNTLNRALEIRKILQDSFKV